MTEHAPTRPLQEPTGTRADVELAYESGVEVKARSQWAYARIRFLRHRLAVASLVVLLLLALVAIFAKRVAPHGYDELDFLRRPLLASDPRAR